MNSIIITTISLWIVAFALYYKTRKVVCLTIPYIAFASNEIMYALTGLEFTPAGDRTGLFYDVSTIPTKYFGTALNFSEGYWPDGDYSISGTQAEYNKYDKIIELLGAKPGDVVLDMGCGTCSMARYFARKGILVEGMTVSDEQIADCQKVGIKAYKKDFCAYHPEFASKYNHLVMMGSPEHIYDGPWHFDTTYVKHNKTMDKVFGYCKQYLKPGGKMFFSGLHINQKYTKSVAGYVLERTYGGTLCLNKSGYTAQDAALRVGMNVDLFQDHTYDYYMATITNIDHFGNASTPCSKGVLLPLIGSIFYPPLIYMSIYYAFGIWMWMFDGQYHTKSCGDNITVTPPYSIKPMQDRPCTLWWGVFSR